MPLTPQDVEALPKAIEEALNGLGRVGGGDLLRSAILSALRSAGRERDAASATEAALRAEVESEREAIQLERMFAEQERHRAYRSSQPEMAEYLITCEHEWRKTADKLAAACDERDRALDRAAAAESREAALRGERDEALAEVERQRFLWSSIRDARTDAAEKARDEACEALSEMLAAIAQYRDNCGEKSMVRGKLAETRARAVLTRIREEPDHE